MADLSQLFNASPGVAGLFTGQAHAMDQSHKQAQIQQLAAIVQEAQQKMRMQEDLHPLELENKRLANQQTREVTIPKGLTELDTSRLTNDYTRATQPGAIGATNAKNAGTVDIENYAKHDRFQNFLYSTSAELSQLPPPVRAAALQSKMKSMNMDPNDPRFSSLLQTLGANPDKMPQILEAMAKQSGQQAANMSPQYLAAVRGHELSKEASLGSAGIHADASRYAADKGAESRVQVQLMKQQQELKAKGFEQQAAGYMDEANKYKKTDPRHAEWRAKAVEATSTARWIREAAKQLPDYGQMGIPMQPPTPNPLDSGASSAPATAPASAAQAAAPTASGTTAGGVGWKVIPPTK